MGGAHLTILLSVMDINQYKIEQEPFYKQLSNEVELYQASYDAKLPVMVKGPTGCGKSRFVEYMAWKLGKPIITVSCNEDITASDLVGRFLLDANGTRWVDGPLTMAARFGAICYLDEIVEARQDTMVVIHSLTDHRRELSLDKKGELIKAHPDFQLVISYNPGYQSLMKDLKQSTKQRFCGLDFEYANREDEAAILMTEGQVEQTIADKLVEVGHVARKLKGHGLDEGISTRLMVYAAKLINQGISPIDACKMAMVRPITDDADVRESLDNAIELIFG